MSFLTRVAPVEDWCPWKEEIRGHQIRAQVEKNRLSFDGVAFGTSLVCFLPKSLVPLEIQLTSEHAEDKFAQRHGLGQSTTPCQLVQPHQL